jgi:hypothetical protein
MIIFVDVVFRRWKIILQFTSICEHHNEQ